MVTLATRSRTRPATRIVTHSQNGSRHVSQLVRAGGFPMPLPRGDGALLYDVRALRFRLRRGAIA